MVIVKQNLVQIDRIDQRDRTRHLSDKKLKNPQDLNIFTRGWAHRRKKVAAVRTGRVVKRALKHGQRTENSLEAQRLETKLLEAAEASVGRGVHRRKKVAAVCGCAPRQSLQRIHNLKKCISHNVLIT